MSVRIIVRNSLLASLVPAAAAIALFAGPANAQTTDHNPPADARPAPTAPAEVRADHNPPADLRGDHNPPDDARPAPTNPAGAACAAAVAARPAPCPT